MRCKWPWGWGSGGGSGWVTDLRGCLSEESPRWHGGCLGLLRRRAEGRGLGARGPEGGGGLGCSEATAEGGLGRAEGEAAAGGGGGGAGEGEALRGWATREGSGQSSTHLVS